MLRQLAEMDELQRQAITRHSRRAGSITQLGSHVNPCRLLPPLAPRLRLVYNRAMSLETALDDLRLDHSFLKNVTVWNHMAAEPARTLPMPGDLDPRLVAALHGRGIVDLYTHQAAAWRAAQRGEHLAVVTPTASGKTLCYNLPVVHALLADPNGRALYLFPTKALAQDQLAELTALQLASAASLAPAAYDGDTPQRNRARIRDQARIILTNPDMLHTGILPHHPRWASFFANLRYVVIDEMHTYRGVFGSHFANVLRRLRRICRFHGAAGPQFLCTSATIANPRQLAERLLEAEVTVIGEDGAPKGERHFIFYNPPIVDQQLGLRRSSTLEAELLTARLLAHGVQTVVFARSRLTVEVLLAYLRERAGKNVAGYRSGYLPGERRAIEQGLRNGSVRAVVATNALELGIDIGGLDAAVLTGFPGAIASTWQQAGRAGRRGAVALAILVATAGVLDQYVISHPEYFFQRSPEQALINPDNLVIFSNHLACAVFELPLAADERFGNVGFTEEVLAYLAENGQVQRHSDKWFWLGETYPAQAISLRTASPDNVLIHASDRGAGAPRREPLPSADNSLAHHGRTVIGEIERAAAPMLLHEGAVYLHGGESYLVERLDWENGQAWVTPAQVDYYTQATGNQQVHVLSIHERVQTGGLAQAYGAVQVISQVSAYRKIRFHTHETLGYGQVDLPEQVLETDAYWMAFGEELLGPLRAVGQWRSDPNDYGPNWQQQRAAARARDGYRCTVCAAPERAGRQHDVHHKVAFRSFGYVPGVNENYRLANQLENLVTLCRACHQRVESGQRLRSGLGGLAYVLGNVAPLHLMCDPRDLGVVSEASTPSNSEFRIQNSELQGTLPVITIFERAPAGIGFSQRLYELHDELLRSASDLVRRCPCQTGCPACVGPLPPDVATDIDPKALTLALIDACLACQNSLPAL